MSFFIFSVGGNYGKKMAKRSGMVALQCLPLCNEEEFELLTSLEVAKELTRCMHEVLDLI